MRSRAEEGDAEEASPPAAVPGVGAAPEPVDPGRGTIRLLAGLAGAGFALSTLVAATFTVIAWFVAARVPNAHDVVGEFASTPDTWSETFELVGIATVIALLTGACAVAAVGLLGVCFRNRRPGRRVLLVVGLGPVAISLAVMGTALLVDAGNAVPATDCDGFRFDAAALASTDRATWEPQARGFVDCVDVGDRSTADVRRMLGPQPSLRVVKTDLRLHDGALVVWSSDGRVVEAFYDDSRGG